MELHDILDILYAKLDTEQITDPEVVMNRVQQLSNCLDFVRVDIGDLHENPTKLGESISLCNTFSEAVAFAGREVVWLRQKYSEWRDVKKFDREVEYNNQLLSDDIMNSGRSVSERRAMASRSVIEVDKELLEYNKLIANLKIIESEFEGTRKRLKQCSFDIKEMKEVMKDTWVISGTNPRDIEKIKKAKKKFLAKPEGVLTKVTPVADTEESIGDDLFDLSNEVPSFEEMIALLPESPSSVEEKDDSSEAIISDESSIEVTPPAITEPKVVPIGNVEEVPSKVVPVAPPEFFHIDTIESFITPVTSEGVVEENISSGLVDGGISPEKTTISEVITDNISLEQSSEMTEESLSESDITEPLVSGSEKKLINNSEIGITSSERNLEHLPQSPSLRDLLKEYI